MTTDATFTPGVQDYIHRGQAMNAAADAERAHMRTMKFDTIAVRGVYGLEAARLNQGSLNEPLYLSPAQVFDDSDHLEAALAYLIPSWTYTRIANPTIGYLEETLALLESYGFDGEASACATASGNAAVFMATNPFLVDYPAVTGGASRSRPNFVSCAKLYGGTFMIFSQRYGAGARRGRALGDRPAGHGRMGAPASTRDTRFVYGEMPSNPSLAVFDIAALAELAHAHDLPLIIDATVATPALMRPLLHGADIVVHSVSKSMATSGFVIAGALVSRHNISSRVGPDEMRQDFAQYVKLLPFRDHGPAISPFAALMALNDLRSLRPRMDLQSRAALQIARTLQGHPQVEAVWYPGLEDSPDHAVASRYMWLADGEDDYGQPVNRYGALLGFTVRGGLPAARRVFDRFELVWRATDLGRIKSVATIPSISTHQQQGEAGAFAG